MTVKQIQCLLAYLGYSPGSIDGIEGRNTQVATLAFQADYGLTADGIPGAATQKMLIGAIAGTAVKVEKPEASTEPKTGTFWDDIKYFTRKEFRCPCGRCGGFPVEPQESMVRTVDEIRHRLGVPVSVVDGGGSGVRCASHNAEVGGLLELSGCPPTALQSWKRRIRCLPNSWRRWRRFMIAVRPT